MPVTVKMGLLSDGEVLELQKRQEDEKYGQCQRFSRNL